ncbi:MAG TPA: carboxypeptidase-like regulatory domain-containing protein, partial [Blastocatellia bacterium]|nr:carboxypeptidase-like regulatory domain-containing protein [Blastocatellia bacterium]
MARVPPSDQTSMFERMLKPSAAPKAVTASDGRYRIEGLPAGKYDITPSAPALVILGDKMETQVIVPGNATVERIDFSLTRGGVISGKITDNEGRPVIAAPVSLKPVDTSYSASFYSMAGNRMFFTDDRGVYRVFGLPAGRYLVSAGNNDGSPFGQFSGGPSRIRTYYPGVTDEPSAKPVEVAAGAEALGVDIKLGVSTKGFVVSGRVVEAETRKPVGITMVAYAAKTHRNSSDKDDDDGGDDEDDERFGAMSGFTMTNARGEFRFESVAPGSYRTITESIAGLSGTTEHYADPLDFEVRSSNLDSLEISVHRGASISGVVFVENAGSSELREQVATLILKANASDPQSGSFLSGAGRVAADGSFRISGLKAGKASISTSEFNPASIGGQKFSVIRIERNGVEQHDGIVVQPNEQITGVRVVVVQANCVIKGHVTLQGGSLPPNSTTWAFARSTASPQSRGDQASPVDARGNFVIEGLAPGDFEIEIRCVSTDGNQDIVKGSAKQN